MMTRIVGVLLLALACVVLVVTGARYAVATDEPQAPLANDCSQFPEKRVWLENQAWVEPQPGNHPNAGKQGHIHVGTCFPLNQTIEGSEGTIPFDLFVQLHNTTGRVWRLRSIPYLNGQPPPPHFTVLDWTCDVADCNRWIHVDFPLSLPIKSGQTELGFWVDMELPNGQAQVNNRQWYNLNRWFVNFQNGKPPLTGGSLQVPYIGGGSWLPGPVTGGSNYANVKIKDMTQFPWNPATGEAIPVSGLWQPKVTFQVTGGADVRSGMAMIDPALHADPPSHGLMVYDGPPGDRTLQIDTTSLANGSHRLLLVGCTQHSTGIKQCGVQVVPFIVEN